MFPGATRANPAKHHDCCEPFADFLSAGKLKQHTADLVSDALAMFRLTQG